MYRDKENKVDRESQKGNEKNPKKRGKSFKVKIGVINA